MGILSPMVFTIYTDDLENWVTKSKVFNYADDTSSSSNANYPVQMDKNNLNHPESSPNKEKKASAETQPNFGITLMMKSKMQKLFQLQKIHKFYKTLPI